MVFALHMPFHQEVGKEIKIDRGENKSRVAAAPATLMLFLLERRAKGAPELAWYVMEHFKEVAVLKLNYIAQEEEEVLRFFTHLRDWIAEANAVSPLLDNGSFKWLTRCFSQWLKRVRCRRATSVVDVFLAREIGINGSGRDAELLGDLTVVGSLKALSSEQFERRRLDAALILFGLFLGDLRHNRESAL